MLTFFRSCSCSKTVNNIIVIHVVPKQRFVVCDHNCADLSKHLHSLISTFIFILECSPVREHTPSKFKILVSSFMHFLRLRVSI